MTRAAVDMANAEANDLSDDGNDIDNGSYMNGSASYTAAVAAVGGTFHPKRRIWKHHSSEGRMYETDTLKDQGRPRVESFRALLLVAQPESTPAGK